MSPNEDQEAVLDGESVALANPNLLGKWATFVFRPPPEPTNLDDLLAEPIVYRARRETFAWANDHTIPFTAVSGVTGVIGLGIASVFSTGVTALIAGGLLGLLLGVVVFFGFEVIYKTPRRKLELQSQRIADQDQQIAELQTKAEHEVEREAWNVHCIEHAAKVAEEQGAKNRARAVEAREALAAKQAALGAIRAQFPEVEPEEVDLHGVE